MSPKTEHPSSDRIRYVGSTLSPTEARFVLEHHDLPGWGIRLVVNKAGLVTNLQLSPLSDTEVDQHPPATEGISARLLRRLPFGEIEMYARASVARSLEREEERDLLRLGGLVEAAESMVRRPGRAGRDDREYALLAARYVELLDSGDSNPVESMAGELTLSPSQIRNLLYQARRRGLLTAARPGRAGGELTAKAQGLLAAQHG